VSGEIERVDGCRVGYKMMKWCSHKAVRGSLAMVGRVRTLVPSRLLLAPG
jgi:hypothetical protein